MRVLTPSPKHSLPPVARTTLRFSLRNARSFITRILLGELHSLLLVVRSFGLAPDRLSLRLLHSLLGWLVSSLPLVARRLLAFAHPSTHSYVLPLGERPSLITFAFAGCYHAHSRWSLAALRLSLKLTNS